MQNLFFAHIGLAYVSLALLLVRGVLSAKQVDWRQYKMLKIAPHLVDTLLLASGVAIFFLFGFSFGESWIWAKLMFIGIYVFCAVKAFKKNAPFSLKHFLLAVVSFMMVMVVATIK
ncbi:invasion protein expression up-regulator SirB [Haemophilus paracuniculus]|uniref:Invasion protein expression up-regulator SirB n=1 Tax=Haemophilus paracuniculus TaxID=734 RepID=A0A1T0AR94_9PAST|nr:SirB2 family protein [Haemophilus paracuniculus]OOR98582.1 invasion protein expression up-regulator SirB [Haemophilus paracuniculus]